MYIKLRKRSRSVRVGSKLLTGNVKTRALRYTVLFAHSQSYTAVALHWHTGQLSCSSRLHDKRPTACNNRTDISFSRVNNTMQAVIGITASEHRPHTARRGHIGTVG